MTKLILETSYDLPSGKTVTSYYSWPLDKNKDVAFAQAHGEAAAVETKLNGKASYKLVGS